MTQRKRSGETEIKVADALFERGALDKDSAVSSADIWILVQPRLPRADAGRAYAADKRFAGHADEMTQAERIAAGQRMFFDDAVATLEKREQLIRDDDQLWLGCQPLYRKVTETGPLELYVPGTTHLRDAEAQQLIDDRKLLKRILDRKAFKIDSGSRHYEALRWSMQMYGVVPGYPILVDAGDRTNVLVGRTRVAVARDLDVAEPVPFGQLTREQQLMSAAQPVRGDASAALRELFRGDVFRRQLTSRELEDVQAVLDESEHGSAAVDEVRQAVAQARQVITEREDAAQRGNELKRARVEELLREDTGRSDYIIAEIAGVAHSFVLGLRKKLVSETSIHAWEFPGGRGQHAGRHSDACWCQPEVASGQPAAESATSVTGPVPEARSAPATMPADVQQEIAERVRAGKPVPRSEWADRDVSERAVQDEHIRAKARQEMLESLVAIAERALAVIHAWHELSWEDQTDNWQLKAIAVLRELTRLILHTNEDDEVPTP